MGKKKKKHNVDKVATLNTGNDQAKNGHLDKKKLPVPRYVPRQYRNKLLYPWQEEVLDSRECFNERYVDCIVDKEGNNGKSTLASMVDLSGQGIDMPTVDEGNKLIQSLCNVLKEKNNKSPGIVFFDMPRAQNKHQLSGLFTAIEQIKKGKVWDFRHRYTEWWFDSPRIWVFTNKLPDMSLLSADRWQFWTIYNKKLVQTTKFSNASKADRA